MTTKIYTRSINLELYRRSQKLITLDMPRVRLVNTTADGYFYRMLADTDCDWAINIDEDAFVVDDQAILALLDHMKQNGYTNCGMSDGVLVRPGNPIVTNPFFNILHLAAIRQQFDPDAIRTFRYTDHRAELEAALPAHLRSNTAGLDLENEEPFYNFFFWLALHFKTLYLDAETHADGISTILKNHRGEAMLYHSWFSRCWRKDKAQTSRIDRLYHEAAAAKQQRTLSPAWAIASPVDRAIQIAQRKARTAIRMLKQR